MAKLTPKAPKKASAKAAKKISAAAKVRTTAPAPAPAKPRRVILSPVVKGSRTPSQFRAAVKTL